MFSGIGSKDNPSISGIIFYGINAAFCMGAAFYVYMRMSACCPYR